MNGPRLFVSLGVSFLLGSMLTSALSPRFTASGTANTCPCPESSSSAPQQSPPPAAPEVASSASSAATVEAPAPAGIYDLALADIQVRPPLVRATRAATITVAVRNTGTLRTPHIVTVRLELTNTRNSRIHRQNLNAEVMDPGSTVLATPVVTVRAVSAFGQDNEWHFPSDGRATVRACIEWSLDTDTTNNCREITVQSGR